MGLVRWIGFRSTVRVGKKSYPLPLASAVLLVMVAIAVGPGLLLLGLGIVSAPFFFLTLGVSIGTVMGLSHWEAARSRE
jgi:hypothetical protein